MPSQSLDDLLDQLVGQYSERLARGGSRDASDLLERVAPEHRPQLERCFRMMQAGLTAAPGSGLVLGPGVQLDGFRIERELGRGGMAVVYLATQIDLRRPVALKVLRPGLAVEGRHVDRFKREALAVARLKHPHIVQVYAVGEAHGYHYLAMEYVEGRTLAALYEALPAAEKRTADDLAREAGLPLDSVAGMTYERALCRLLAPVVRALATTHEFGLVHRDVKPSNILVHKDGRAVIADFGLAKGDGDPGLSLTGEPLGTPFYMSPEQATLNESQVDQRTDVYSLGVTLYEGLGGRRPFEGPTVIAVLEAVRRQHAPSLHRLNHHVTRDAEAVVRRAMARDAGDRYPSALELAAELQALADGAPTQARAREGGKLRRLQVALRSYQAGELYEFRSRASFLGLPLLHIMTNGRGRGKSHAIAKGWIALGDVAVGGIAIGGISMGVLAVGAMALGGACFGGVTAGILPIGGVAFGFAPLGGFAAGFSAIGGGAWGYYAMGGDVHGVHVVTNEVRDAQAIEWFRHWVWWLRFLPGAGRLIELLG